MGMATIYLIRHAEAEPYFNGGDSARPLSTRGRKQAAWMGKHLKGTHVDDFRCAPHQRCRETAEIIGEALGMQPEVDDRLHIARGFTVDVTEGTSVWVAHSNNIPDAVHALGVRPHHCGHASAWKLELDDEGQLVSSEYIEPKV